MKPDAHSACTARPNEDNPNPDCYEKLAPIYEELYGEIDTQESVRQWWQLLMQQKLVPQNPNGLRLLDIGCGTGLHLIAWRELGFEVVGLDSSAAMLKIARKNLNAAGFECPLYQADIRDGGKLPDLSGFDIAVSHLNFLNMFSREERLCLFYSAARMVCPGGLWLTDFTEPSSPPSASNEVVTLEGVSLNRSSNYIRNQNCMDQLWKGKNLECRERYWFGHAAEAEKLAAQSGWKIECRKAWHPNTAGREWGNPSDTDENLVDIYERLGEMKLS